MQFKKLILNIYWALIVFGLISTSFGQTKPESDIKKLDRIIAIVDQDVITEKELQEKINSVISNLKSQKIETP